MLLAEVFLGKKTRIFRGTYALK